MPTIELTRQSKETSIRLRLNPYGEGQLQLATGLGFFDHFLTSLAYYAGWDLELSAQGDLEVDGHHLVEDVALALGAALEKSQMEGRQRYGHALLPMDDALVLAALDSGGRPYFAGDIPGEAGAPGPFTGQLAQEFFRSLCHQAGWCLHLQCLRWENGHHLLEALAKAAGLAMAQALQPGARASERSTKGRVEWRWELKA